jgi:amino acid transporter
MELDSLKYVWRTLESVPSPQKSPEEIHALLQRRSGGIVTRMQRNLIAELILILTTYTPAILFYFLDFEGKLSGIAWLFILLLATLAVYFYRKNQLLKAMQCAGCSLHSNLQQQINTLKKYIRFYVWSGTIMIPVMIILSWLIIRWKFPPAPGAALFYRLSGTPWWQHPLTWTALLIPVTIGMYFANSWYVHRLYGRHIRKLQELLREMEEE